MNVLRLFTITLIFYLLIGNLFAQYWFQFGVRGDNSASQNNGASVEIETIKPQNLTSGSLGFWVGEILSNGAFLQTGYVIENQTGNYPSICTENGCSNYETLKAGDAEWFYEYFPPNSNSGFLGGIGPDGSAGANGTFHTYGFYSIGNTWYFTFDGKVIGSADLGTSTSGAQVPAALGELANTSTSSTYIKDVIFENLSVYKYGLWLPVSTGYSYIGYGVGSEKGLRNPYGVKEVDNRINYFEVGSGLPQPMNGTELWSLGYYLKIKSKYGNINQTSGYIAYSTVQISAPRYIYISPGVRAEFKGWTGYGIGSYTGPSNITTINLDSNITEVANWNIEYMLNITSPFGNTTGSGWYSNGTRVYYSVRPLLIYKNRTTRYEFAGWSNGNLNASGYIDVNRPINLVAIWNKEYLVSATTPFGNATGSGWYRNNTIIVISLPKKVINQTAYERLAFYQWSNGNNNESIKVLVNKPINITAIYKKQYLVNIIWENAYSQPINVEGFEIGNSNFSTNRSIYLFADEPYKINYVLYKGVKIEPSSIINITSPGNIYVKLNVYNVSISTKDIFGFPVNAYAMLSFSNGSSLQTYTNGHLELSNLPYGYVNGSISYLGISQHILLSGGAGATLIFFSELDIEVALLVILAIAIAYFVGMHMEKKREANKQYKQDKNQSQNMQKG
jgi:hypothetical protein